MLGLENQKEKSGLRTVDKGSCKYLKGKMMTELLEEDKPGSNCQDSWGRGENGLRRQAMIR